MCFWLIEASMLRQHYILHNTDNKNSNNVTKACQAYYFPFKDITMGHKIVAYHLNHKIDSPHPTMYVFFCKADDELKSNSLFVNFYAE